MVRLVGNAKGKRSRAEQAAATRGQQAAEKRGNAKRPRRDSSESVWNPVIPTPPERLSYLRDQEAKIGAYVNANAKAAFPEELRNSLRDHKKWIHAGVRQATGQTLARGNVPGNLPAEGVLIQTAFEHAQNVESLIAECEASVSAA